jgi:hypothetical protein
VALREMARLSQRWKEFHERVWRGGEAVGRQLKRLPSEKYTEAMLRALEEAEDALAYLGENWLAVQNIVAALRRKVEKVLGGTEAGR